MEEKKLNTKLIKSLMERKNDFEVGEKEKFAYKNEYGNVWSLVLRREEEQYSPFIFAIEGNKVGTNETWSRRYTSMEQALLHIVNDFNENVILKELKANNLEFHELFDCQEYVYLWSGHPLAKKKEITLEDLEDYPFLSFDQGSNNSFYFAEEVFSTYEYKQSIKANDRATMLNLMKGLNGYTLCSGIICENLNGSEYCAVKLSTEETMTIGYLKRKGIPLSSIGKEYLKEISKYNVTIQHTIHRIIMSNVLTNASIRHT